MTMQRREAPTLFTSSPRDSPSSDSKKHSPLNDVDWKESNDSSDEELLTKPLFRSITSLSNSAHSNSDDPVKTSVGKYKEEMRKRRITSHSSYITHQIFDRLQGIYLSKKFSSYVPISTNEDGGLHPSGRIPLVKGIDRVVSGAQPAAEAVTICGIKPYRYFWYMLSGMCCDSIQLAIDFCLFHAFNITDPSACWILGFGSSIIFRHSFHRYLVFGAYVGGYCKSLTRMYAGYSIIMVISTIFNIVMTKVFLFSHYEAWIATLLWTGIVNYFILKHIWSFGGSSGDKRKEEGSSVELSGRNRESENIV